MRGKLDTTAGLVSGKVTEYRLNRRVVGPQSRTGRFEEGKSHFAAGRPTRTTGIGKVFTVNAMKEYREVEVYPHSFNLDTRWR